MAKPAVKTRTGRHPLDSDADLEERRRRLLNHKITDKSGNFITRDPLVVFLYMLLRDRITAGELMRTVVEATLDADSASQEPTRLSNGYLAEFAQFLAGELQSKRVHRPEG
jgi:predicted nucleic-acid-binding protein